MLTVQHTYETRSEELIDFNPNFAPQIPTTCLWASGDYQIKLHTPVRTQSKCMH